MEIFKKIVGSCRKGNLEFSRKGALEFSHKVTLESLCDLHSSFDLLPFVFFFLMVFCFSCKKNTENIRLEKGMVISESVTVAKDTFRINADERSKEAAILIQGENIVVDFQGAVLQGSNDKIYPNELYGVGIQIKGSNIEIRNLKIHGYQVGIFALGVDGLKILDSEISYNFRCNSFPEHDCGIGIKNNGYVTGVAFDDCKNILFKNNIVLQNQIGIIASNCENGKIYNNQITYNSHTGILNNGSSNVMIMHNFLDWNREFGIRCSSKSHDNIIAYNSITHTPFNSPAKNIGFKNNHFPFDSPNTPDSLSVKFPPFPDAQNTDEFPSPFKGEEYFLFNEWGVYNFQYPSIWLREINDNKYTFAIFGPEGNWKIVNGNGFMQTSRQSGSTPATIVATTAKNSTEALSLDLEFIGVEFIDQFGRSNPRGKTYQFGFKSKED